ncbi:lipopolysaccharide-induced tumor necrosis factor-alpha factor homolog isoform X1 [Argiope bruennichi]|nr:lipopolysaccharide-induced tumor necrosis factor-alpha factor homolog isoform X1 [Argiope bruennichi]XP_055939761.1 lipopolysaccharide-induced tumor necrosis factor-alpha factor homolog isoform X1 [Argiope bruennichi]
MAEKTGYHQVPPQGPPPQGPPPYGPAEPPPAYTTGPYMAGEGYPYMNAPPPQHYAGYQAPPTVVIGAPTTAGGPPTVVTVVKVGQWGPYPMQVGCPQCGARIMTETTASPGLLTWLLSGALVFVGCWLGCCLIPCCIPECQDIEHRCPNCKAHLGTFRRL